MSRIVDNLIAYRVLSMLVKSFKDTDAFKLGIIDGKGKNLIKPSFFTTDEQRDAYSYLHRLVFNMKRIINKLPGGENKLKSLATALYLIKEYYAKNERSLSLMEERFDNIMGTEAILAEETILVEKWNTYKREKTGKKEEEIQEDGVGAVGGAPANSGGTGVALGSAGASTGTVSGNSLPLKKKKGTVARRATPLA
jgi:hypothetical protein